MHHWICPWNIFFLVLPVLDYHMNDPHLGLRYTIAILFYKWTDQQTCQEVRLTLFTSM
jgi:hypothetical protein